MRKRTIVVLIVLVGVMSYFSVGFVGTYNERSTYEGLVILNIADLDDAIYSDIYNKLSKEMNSTIEYACVQSGIVVIKIVNSTLREKSDNGLMIRNQLGNTVMSNKVDILFIDIRPQVSVSKC